jgi:erythronate-4-phosphate dehydrogenase
MINVVADDKIPFLKGVLEPFADIVYVPGSQITNSTLRGADALLTRTRTKCTADLLERTRVKFIGTATIGYDHIDTGYCAMNNIKWANAPGCNSSSVQQYITAALLKLENDKNFVLKGKTIGIIGVGNVGSKVEKTARILGMNVLLNDPPRARKEGAENFVSIYELLKRSDIVTMHVPLIPEGDDATFHLMNDSTFKLMREDAWFINTSRGEITDTSAVYKALLSGNLAGAILDVWENEPDIDAGLLSHSFLATPHIAGYSADGKANGTAMTVNALSSIFNLPLKTWYPDKIPDPSIPVLKINGEKRSDEDIIREAVFHTYDIKEDYTRLRKSPADFEKQRGSYPLRREFSAYTIKAVNCTLRCLDMLKSIGFRVNS